MVSWTLVFAEKRKIVGKPPANKKFPGVDKLRAMLKTMPSKPIAEELGVTQHTITNWVVRYHLQGISPFITIRAKKKKAEEAQAEEVETVAVREYTGNMMYKWAKVKLSKAQEINGWFRRMPI